MNFIPKIINSDRVAQEIAKNTAVVDATADSNESRSEPQNNLEPAGGDSEQPLSSNQTADDSHVALLNLNSNNSNKFQLNQHNLVNGKSVGRKPKVRTQKNKVDNLIKNLQNNNNNKSLVKINRQINKAKETIAGNKKKVSKKNISNTLLNKSNSNKTLNVSDISDVRILRSAKKNNTNFATDAANKKNNKKKSNSSADSSILEFVNGLVINKITSLDNLTLIDEDNMLVTSNYSSKLLLLYDKLKKNKFQLTKYFTADAIVSFESNLALSKLNAQK